MPEILILAILSTIGKVMEDVRKIELLTDRARRLKDVHGLYEAFNVHLAISLAVFAYLLSNNVDRYYIICMISLVMLGVGCKGAFSHHKPERLEWADSDAKWGMIIPNGCAIAAILV